MKHAARTAAAAGLAMLLSGCFMSPGKFTSDLRINEDGRFAFFYTGEISILGIGELAEMGANADDDEFSAQACTTNSGETRECTASELTAQREAWDEEAPARADKRLQEAQMAKMMLGEMDLSDPQNIDEFTRKLQRQRGWEEVSYRDDGIFDVRFAIDGTLDHDFMFPTMEGSPLPGSFVQVYLRDDDIVRVEAPAFSAAGSGPAAGLGSFGQLMGMAARSEASNDSKAEIPNIPPIDGTFTIQTNATILANNTDEGPNPTPTGYVLSWRIDKQTSAAPTALLQLKR
ncbi:hypothetical protein GRI94_09355 [Erythrobacter jejuensis]|uniref:Lipoprotein n=2 Tax=Parerythrobacter jejuensis TaxID=795812 RepID=A0A845ARL2_9SPHN|nr:hypothetical protein [Parerythrobacter jejuensis]